MKNKKIWLGLLSLLVLIFLIPLYKILSPMKSQDFFSEYRESAVFPAWVHEGYYLFLLLSLIILAWGVLDLIYQKYDVSVKIKKTTKILVIIICATIIIGMFFKLFYYFSGRHSANQSFIFDSYQKCDTDNDCVIVKSPHPCKEVEAMNKKVAEEDYVDYYESYLRKFSDYDFKCSRSELNMDNSRPICQDSLCKLVETNTEYAKEGEYCQSDSSLKKNQCDKGLICTNQETGKEAMGYQLGICNKQDNSRYYLACAKDDHCILQSDSFICVSCDYACPSYKCVDQETSSKLFWEREKRINNPNIPTPECAMCMPEDSPLIFRCICEDGECLKKVATCDNDNDCMSELYFFWEAHKCIDGQCVYVDEKK